MTGVAIRFGSEYFVYYSAVVILYDTNIVSTRYYVCRCQRQSEGRDARAHECTACYIIMERYNNIYEKRNGIHFSGIRFVLFTCMLTEFQMGSWSIKYWEKFPRNGRRDSVIRLSKTRTYIVYLHYHNIRTHGGKSNIENDTELSVSAIIRTVVKMRYCFSREKSIVSHVACDETVNTQYDVKAILESRRHKNKCPVKDAENLLLKKRRVEF